MQDAKIVMSLSSSYFVRVVASNEAHEFLVAFPKALLNFCRAHRDPYTHKLR